VQDWESSGTISMILSQKRCITLGCLRWVIFYIHNHFYQFHNKDSGENSVCLVSKYQFYHILAYNIGVYKLT